MVCVPYHLCLLLELWVACQLGKDFPRRPEQRDLLAGPESTHSACNQLVAIHPHLQRCTVLSDIVNGTSPVQIVKHTDRLTCS
jgi:hypothetical protein